MQGTVVKIEVKEGDIVEAGALLFVLEAMKMEQPLTAHRSGKISSLSLGIGDSVTTGALLAIIDEL
jgi:acetyl-CoA/propionyl-CoA carboxylase biotin carboxyl carrier protein